MSSKKEAFYIEQRFLSPLGAAVYEAAQHLTDNKGEKHVPVAKDDLRVVALRALRDYLNHPVELQPEPDA